MVLLPIRIPSYIPITMIICEVIMNKLKFIINVVDTVIRIAQLIKSDLQKKDSENEKDSKES